MEWLLAISLLSSFIGAMVNYSSNQKANYEQRQHDKEMLEAQTQAQKDLMNYQNNLTQETNMIATQKGQMASAGYSPALMYGSSMPTANVSGGSASGGANSLNRLQLFDKLPIDSTVGTLFQGESQRIARERLESEKEVNSARAQLDLMKTAHEYYDTNASKRLQQTIVDKAYVDLENSKLDAENKRFILERGRVLLPGELANQNLINQETARKCEKIQSDMEVNGVAMREMRANIGRLSKLNEVSDAEKNQIIESTRRSQLGRVMSEFGLQGRLTPPQLRSANALHNALNNTQMKGAYITLRNLGFSEHEATNAVLYYSASDPKDVTPSTVNAASRIFSALVLKK